MKILSLQQFRAAALAVSLAGFGVGCGGSGSASNSPLAPGSTVANGVWTGTLTRPAGLAPIAMRWDAVLTDTGLKGPLTLTNSANVSVTIQGIGQSGGNDSSGYRIHMQFLGNAGDIPSLPGCSILGNTQNTPPDAFPSPFNKITVAAFDINYNGCKGFVDPVAPASGVHEVVQLSMSK